ncbi:hypothetical protein [Frateuria sp.]|uniref:hypothetical protein n=1 Tax=Frateuria sp. TaxID=2211372 RepID=UPI003F7E1039
MTNTKGRARHTVLGIGLLAFAFLAGCASSSRAVKPSAARPVQEANVLSHEWDQKEGERRIPVTIVRDKGSVGAFVHTVLLVDRHPVAILDRKEEATLFLSPGQHIFTVSYLKHLHGRPLGEYALPVREGASNAFRIRLVLGDAPRIEPYDALDPVAGSGKPSWHDRENLEQYADPGQIAAIVDAAIAHAAKRDWWKTLAGRGMNEHTRYVYTRKGGWVDLKHVISTASNPGCYVPGASVFGAWMMEVMQVFYAPFSAFEEEDFLSNRIGGHAAIRYAATLGREGSRGKIVQRAIDRLEPMNLTDAAAHFHVALPIKRWPFDPSEVAPIAAGASGKATGGPAARSLASH